MSYESTLKWYADNDPRDYLNLKKLILGQEAVESASVKTATASEEKISIGYDADGDGDVDEDDIKTIFPLSEYGARKRWIHWAKDAKTQKNRGAYYGNGGMPSGLVVHWTSGHPDSTFTSFESQAANSAYSYLFITDDGTLGQSNPLTQKGYHTGKSVWKGMSPVHNYMVGVELLCPGKLKDIGGGKAKTWFSRIFSISDCRVVESKDNIVGGIYYKYTEAQEDSLFTLCLWMKWNDPEGFSFENVVGHDEISPGRKTDPGGSLCMTMPEFRTALKEKWEEIKP